MPTLTIRNSITGAGLVAQDNRSISVDNAVNASGETIAAALAGTAGESGVMTLALGHGITDSDEVGVYWSGGYRYNCTVASYDTTTITLSGGAGTELPTSGTVYVSVKTELDIAFSGDALAALSIGSTIGLYTTIEDGSTVHAVKETAANAAYQWDSGNTETNPVAGDDVTKMNVYNQSTTAGTVTILIGYDNA